MRIAMIINSFPVISEKFLLNHIAGAITAGQNITVYASHRERNPVKHELIERYGVDQYIRYLDIPRQVYKRVLAGSFLFVRLFFKNPVAAIQAVNIKKYKTVAKNMKLLYFGNVLISERFDVVHCHFGVNGLIGAYLKHCGIAKTLITTFHGSDINTYPRKFGLTVYSTLYSTADAITANTSFTKSKIVANGCPSEKIHVIPVGLFCDDYSTVSRKNIESYSLLTVGRLEEKKGHIYALRAVALLTREFPETRYYIAGDGSLRSRLQEYCVTLGIQKNVVFLGVATSEAIKNLYDKVCVFTLPSITASNGDMEGQGLVIQEAQMCGIPVVTTRHNGIPDGLLEDVSGFLVNEKDEYALADRIKYLFNNPKKGISMGISGKDFVKSKYEISILTQRINALYQLVLDGLNLSKN